MSTLIHAKPKVLSIRLTQNQTEFIETVRGDLLPGEAVKTFIEYLSRFDREYSKRILGDMKHG